MNTMQLTPLHSSTAPPGSIYRHNLLILSYRGLSGLLSDTLQGFERGLLSGDTSLRKKARQIQQLIVLLNTLAKVEAKYIWNIIALKNPELIENLRDRDRRNMDLLLIIRDKLLSSPQVHPMEVIAAAIRGSMTTGMYCLNKKEAMVRTCLQQVYANEDMNYMWREVLHQLPPEEAALLCRWMVLGLSEKEIAGCIRQASVHLANDLYQRLLKNVKATLSSRSWLQVEGALAEGALLA